MEKKQYGRNIILLLLAYLLITLLLWFATQESLKTQKKHITTGTEHAETVEISRNQQLSYTFKPDMEYIDELLIPFDYKGKNPTESITVQVIRSNEVVFLKKTQLVDFQGKYILKVVFPKNIDYSLTNITIEISSSVEVENSLFLFLNPVRSVEKSKLILAGNFMDKDLCFDLYGSLNSNYDVIFWITALVGGILSLFFLLMLAYKDKQEKPSYILRLLENFKKVRFLIAQLVARDFRTKYKRSFLGVVWSFLNPLLTMLIQYIIFSTIFKQSIANFPVYLLVGVIFFNFFSEATTIGVGSIVDNASLITKVYIPKYVFPLSRVISSCINLLISLIPLIFVVLLTGLKPRLEYILLIFPIFWIFVFSLGIVFALASVMVFFRDTRFIWNFVTMLWMYATPIFYPEDIISEKFLIILKLNPLYHFIRFARIIVMESYLPTIQMYFYCTVAAVVPLVLGALIFKKLQNKFILNI